MDTDTLTVPSSELRVGDIVHTHRMDVRLVSRVQMQGGGVSCVGAVLTDLDQVRADRIVPVGWLLDNPTGQPLWTVQGNDYVRWSVTRPCA